MYAIEAKSSTDLWYVIDLFTTTQNGRTPGQRAFNVMLAMRRQQRYTGHYQPLRLVRR